MFEDAPMVLDEETEEEEEASSDDVIILHMDIRHPLSMLLALVEEKIGVNLKNFKFFLQDLQELESHKTLVDQCVKGEGLVQINVQVHTNKQRINIVDVLKPTDEALAAMNAAAAKDQPGSNKQNSNKKSATTPVKKLAKVEDEAQDSDAENHVLESHKRSITAMSGGSSDSEKNKPCLNWVLDSKFKREQTRLKIPEDPNEWTQPQVKYWFQWAMREFHLSNVTASDWALTGKELCAMTHDEFMKKVVNDPGMMFWTHLQLLKECKFVSVVHKEVELSAVPKEPKIMRKSLSASSKSIAGSISGNSSPTNSNSALLTSPVSNMPHTHTVGSGNNGQVQLWQFLLELLTDRERTDVIQWVGTDGEFKLTDAEAVARLWGERKNKPAMNYEKLSRALRYYYDGDMISKVSGKRFAYKFDCDLKLLIGYDAGELARLVNEKPFAENSAMYLNHINDPSDEE